MIGSVLIVDDDRFFADALRSALEASGIRVAGIASNLSDASDIARRSRPRVVLVDERLDHPAGGPEAAFRPDGHGPVIVSLVSTRPSVEAAERPGAWRGWVARDDSKDDLINAVRVALGVGESAQLGRSSPPPKRSANRAPRAEELTHREWEVLRLMAEGLSSKRIAERLSIGINTVNTHAQSILAKLGVHTRLAATALALDRKLLDSRKPEAAQGPESP